MTVTYLANNGRSRMKFVYTRDEWRKATNQFKLGEISKVLNKNISIYKHIVINNLKYLLKIKITLNYKSVIYKNHWIKLIWELN